MTILNVIKANVVISEIENLKFLQIQRMLDYNKFKEFFGIFINFGQIEGLSKA